MTWAFSPLNYRHTERCPVSNDLWVELDGNENVPVSCDKRFYHPTKRAQKEWPAMLNAVYGLKEDVFYNPAITGLINEVTPEMIESFRKTMFKGIIDSRTKKPWEPPATLSVESYLEMRRNSIYAEHAAGRTLLMMGAQESPEITLSEWEERLVQWRPDYGFLVDHRQQTEFLARQPKDSAALKHEVVREYLFCIPAAQDVILSVAQEPNTDRAIWGLRRTMHLDWPFDCPGNTFLEILEETNMSVPLFVEQFNELAQNLEDLLAR
ncbi:hypothetical protein HYZ97_01185 [Candidatus Pacearchaeota archaeon]|nr:hypothetical protein [Candidatus Pacearchaeota archaeon]